MKHRSFLIISIVGVLCVGWLGSREYDYHASVRGDDALRQRITTAEQARAREMEEASLFKTKDGKARRPNWNRVLELLKRKDGIASLEVSEWALDASQEELMEAIAELRLEKGEKRSLERMKGILYDRLREIDCGACMEAGTVGGFDPYFAKSSGYCLKLWMRKDPSAAIRWYDQKLAEGLLEAKSLDGINSYRTSFELAVFSHFLKSDPAESERRLSGLPNEMRKNVLRNADFHLLDAKGQVELARIIRSGFSAQEASGELVENTVSDAKEKPRPFESAMATMDNIHLTPDERKSVFVGLASELAVEMIQLKNRSPQDALEEMRSRVAEYSPGLVDPVAASSLKRLADLDRLNQPAVITYIDGKIAAGGDEDTLIYTFFMTDVYSVPRGDVEQWRALARRISDPEKQKKILKNLR